MSLRSIFQGVTDRLSSQRWTGENKRLVEELVGALNSTEPVNMTEPLVLDSQLGSGSPIIVLDSGGSNQAIQVINSDGQLSTLGIGLGSRGLVANELHFNPTFTIGPRKTQEFFVNDGTLQTDWDTSGDQHFTVIDNAILEDNGYVAGTPGGEGHGSGSGNPSTTTNPGATSGLGGYAGFIQQLFNWLRTWTGPVTSSFSGTITSTYVESLDSATISESGGTCTLTVGTTRKELQIVVQNGLITSASVGVV